MATTETTDPGMPPPEFFKEMAKHCRCCPECELRPCETACAGGVCLGDCRCDERDDDEDDGYDPNGCHGCGGNCVTACR